MKNIFQLFNDPAYKVKGVLFKKRDPFPLIKYELTPLTIHEIDENGAIQLINSRITDYQVVYNDHIDVSSFIEKNREWIPLQEDLPHEEGIYEITIKFLGKSRIDHSFYSPKNNKWFYISFHSYRLSPTFEEIDPSYIVAWKKRSTSYVEK